MAWSSRQRSFPQLSPQPTEPSSRALLIGRSLKIRVLFPPEVIAAQSLLGDESDQIVFVGEGSRSGARGDPEFVEHRLHMAADGALQVLVRQ